MSNYYREVKGFTEELKEGYKLSDFEALQIAVKMQHNRIVASSFLVGTPDSSTASPVALEAMAMALGMSRNINAPTIPDAIIQGFSDLGETIAEAIKEK
jgi:hypothetical protein